LLHISSFNEHCPNCQYIFDIHFDHHITHVWTKNILGETFHYPLLYHPLIYISGKDLPNSNIAISVSLSFLAEEISSHEAVVGVKIVQKYLSSSEDFPTDVIEVSIYSPLKLSKVIDDFKSQNYIMYNTDLNIRQQFFLDTNSSPLVACHLKFTKIKPSRNNYTFQVYKLKKIINYSDPISLDYSIPKLSIVKISVDINKNKIFPSFDDPIASITLIYNLINESPSLEKIYSFNGVEKEILLNLVSWIRQFDPDFLDIRNGDKFVLNYLAYRAAKHNISNQFCLDRLNQPILPRKNLEGKTYMSYGQVIRRNPIWYIAGRIHIDHENSFFIKESGILGLIDLSRLSGIPLERTARSTIGTALTGIELKVNASSYPSCLVPSQKAKPELFKSANHLLISDNGGLIYPAKPGVYDQVWAIDFTSLYPMIMAIHNIGNETIHCNHDFCSTNLELIPEVNYHVCQKKIGIVPSSMYLVLQRRLNLKMQKKVLKNDDSRNLLSSIDSVMKWILVSCFGYLGFKNARWGSLESHQSVTALARRYLMIAKEICEHEGFSVIAGITDSLFIRSNNNINDNLSSINSLMYKITMKIGIPVDLEGKFNWLVFGSIRNNSQISALNRYFGLFSHDEFKLRGIRMRQRRATKLEIEFQDRVLNHFKNAITKIDFLEKIPSSYFILQNYIEKLYRKDIIATDLIIKLKSGRGSSGYISNNTIQSLTVQRYSNLGYDIYPGMSFHFVVVDNTLKNTEKIRIGPEISDNTKYDSNYYIELLNKCYLEITEDSQLLLFGRIKYSSDGIINSLDDYVTNL